MYYLQTLSPLADLTDVWRLVMYLDCVENYIVVRKLSHPRQASFCETNNKLKMQLLPTRAAAFSCQFTSAKIDACRHARERLESI